MRPHRHVWQEDKAMSPDWSVFGIGVGLASKCRRAGGKAWKMAGVRSPHRIVPEKFLAGVAGVCPGTVPLELRQVCFWFFQRSGGKGAREP